MKHSIRGQHYEVNVIGNGEPLLLIHGFAGSQGQWIPFVERWSSSYQLILIDMLGHGGSATPLQVERYVTEQVTADLVQLLDELGIASVHMLGYSMGGRIALSFAMQEQSRVRSLILESSSPGLASEQERIDRRASDQHLAERIQQQGIHWFAEFWGSLPLFATLQRLPESELTRLHAARLANSPLGLSQSLRGIGTGQQPSWWEQLGELTIPVLLIAGELDLKYCGIAQLMHQKLQHCELELVAEAGHNVHMEQPHLFDTIVMRFLDQIRMV
jgi:2-succinyl-6-hydroxy-2,4-cyclohexadiene-1-carboxylate synthase